MKPLIVLLLLLTSSVYAQNYEIYTGAVISRDKDIHSNYMLGANFIIKTNQERKYFNNLILGFEHGAYMSNEKIITSNGGDNSIVVDCNCKESQMGIGNADSYTTKKEIRTVSLNFGVSVVKRLYLMTGITNSKHIVKMNREEIGSNYTTHIDAGLKYFIPVKRWFFSPMIKFNPESTTFGLGISYN